MLEKISGENYKIKFPSGKRKEKIFHINMLKKFHQIRQVNVTTKEKADKEEENLVL